MTFYVAVPLYFPSLCNCLAFKIYFENYNYFTNFLLIFTIEENNILYLTFESGARTILLQLEQSLIRQSVQKKNLNDYSLMYSRAAPKIFPSTDVRSSKWFWCRRAFSEGCCYRALLQNIGSGWLLQWLIFSWDPFMTSNQFTLDIPGKIFSKLYSVFLRRPKFCKAQ